MKKILLFGAGRSAIYFIEYFSRKELNCSLTVVDNNESLLQQLPANIIKKKEDILNIESIQELIQNHDIVVSLLPAHLHIEIAKICLQKSKHFCTASYVSDAMQVMSAEIENRKLIFLNELGLDPGLDHLSAAKLLDAIKMENGEIISFESYCGGLIAEESIFNNPWKYKFSWNPRNVILAGQGGLACYKKDHQVRYLPYHQLFANCTKIHSRKFGTLDGYANRNSLQYEKLYQLEKANTLIRGTLRREFFCNAWNILVQLGFTDNQTLLNKKIVSPKSFAKAMTGWNGIGEFSQFLTVPTELKAHIDFLEFENEERIEIENEITAAQMLEKILLKKWELQPEDKDEVIMIHKIEFVKNNKHYRASSTLQIKGDSQSHTAMAKTVGLPLALGVEMILNGKITEYGVIIPFSKQWYEPILNKLKPFGIEFTEEIETV